MNAQDKSFLTTFTGVMAVLVVIAVAIFLISRGVALVNVEPDDGSRRAAAIEQRIAPVTRVAIAEPPPEGAEQVAMSGEEIYNGVCSSCHTAGVLGAPKLGSQTDWAPRAEMGLDALVSSAVAGKGSMPAKGGNPNLTEEDIRKAVVYMLDTSEIAMAGAAEPAQEQAAAEAAPAAGGMDLAQGKEVYDGLCMACHVSGAAGAPMLSDAAAWETRAEQGLDALVSSAVNGKGAMPAKGGNPSLSEDDIRNAVSYMLDQAGVSAGGEAAEAAPAEAAPAEAAPAEAAPAEAAPAVDLARGKEVYDGLCMACHVSGAAGAPMLTDTAAWEERAKQGYEALVGSVLNGKGAMPAKGGNPSLTEADIRGAVSYMLEQAGVSVGGETAEAAPAEPAPLEQAAGADGGPEQGASGARAQAAGDAPPLPAGVELSDLVPTVETVGSSVLPEGIDLERGRQLYNTACIICHDAGIAGAPRFGDAAAWAPRIARGFDTLVQHSVTSYGSMPARGGRMDVPESIIIAAVGYMVSSAR